MSMPLPAGRGASSGRPPSARAEAQSGAIVPIGLRHAATTWSKALLSDCTNTELERALDLLAKHPDAYSTGYSVASTARRRLTAELAQRLEAKLNKLNTTRKPSPLS